MIANRKLMNKKAITWRNMATIIIVITVMLFILLVISGDARALAKNLIGLGASDESVWKQKCTNACENAKTQVTDCLKNNAEWNALYCNQEYNDVMTCAQAEADPEVMLSKCEYKDEDEVFCSCGTATV